MNRHSLPLLLAGLLVACEGGGPVPAPGELVQSSQPRDLAPDPPPADVAELVAGNTAFAFALHDVIRDDDPGNLFYSPYSISIALGMTWAGARGETETQMAGALSFTLPQERLHPAFNHVDLELASRGEGAEGQDGGEFRLNVVNAIWGQTGYTFLDPFLDTLSIHYGAGMRLLDFVAAPEDARLRINAWVEDQTESRIRDLLPEGSITIDTRLVLTNAIYFNAAWSVPFDEAATHPASFTRLDGTTKSVAMMQGAGDDRRHALIDGVEAVELPYDGHELSMVVLVPDAGRFAEVDAALGDRVAAVLAALAYQSVDLSMPKFEFEAPLGLREPLIEMGMPLAFSAAADFSGVDGIGGLCIYDVLHKAYVSVNEAGTEAAAATAVIEGVTGVPPPPIPMVVDRPFFFLIRDLATGSVLFVGRVVDP